MSNEIIPALDDIPHGEEGIRLLLGMIWQRQNSLSATMQDVKEEQNTVHDIVDTMSEGVRTLNRKVDDMEPLVESYKMSEKQIHQAVDLAMQYRDSTIERRGVNKMLGILIGVVGVVGGALGTLGIEAIKWYVGRKG